MCECPWKVWQSGEWTILHVKSGGAETTISLRADDANTLARALAAKGEGLGDEPSQGQDLDDLLIWLLSEADWPSVERAREWRAHMLKNQPEYVARLEKSFAALKAHWSRSARHWLHKIVDMGKDDGQGAGVPLAPGSAPLSDDARLIAREAARYATTALSELPSDGSSQQTAPNPQREGERVRELEAALRPFAEQQIDEFHQGYDPRAPMVIYTCRAEIEAARAALARSDGERCDS